MCIRIYNKKISNSHFGVSWTILATLSQIYALFVAPIAGLNSVWRCPKIEKVCYQVWISPSHLIIKNWNENLVLICLLDITFNL